MCDALLKPTGVCEPLEISLSGTGTAEYAQKKKNNKEMSGVTDETRCVYGSTRRLVDES